MEKKESEQEMTPLEPMDLMPEEVLSRLPWLKNADLDTALLLIHSMSRRFPPHAVSTAVLLWGLYVFMNEPRIQKPAVFAASMEYVISQLLEEDPVTQTQLAQRYQISAAAISQRSQEIFDFIENMLLGDWLHDMPDGDLSHVLEEFRTNLEISDSYEPKDARSRAQMLIYDAWEAPTLREQKRLAKRALHIYPDAADAYVIFAEQESSLHKALEYYRKGVEAGERDLGPKYFKENRGHFWGLVETRPYMRAKAGYAAALWKLGRHEEAIREYEEMLDLNPNDNQGIRYRLLTCYLDRRQYDRARQLFDQYEGEVTAFFRFNEVLLEYGIHGFTPTLLQLLEEANDYNPYVISYLLGERLLPDELPDYIGFGDEAEAIAYAFDNTYLWHREKPVMDWLKRVSEHLERE